MRYFNLEQHREPRSMFKKDEQVTIDELLSSGKEISEDEAYKNPSWGSGNISIDEQGKWQWTNTNWDSSG